MAEANTAGVVEEYDASLAYLADGLLLTSCLEDSLDIDKCCQSTSVPRDPCRIVDSLRSRLIPVCPNTGRSFKR